MYLGMDVMYLVMFECMLVWLDLATPTPLKTFQEHYNMSL